MDINDLFSFECNEVFIYFKLIDDKKKLNYLRDFPSYSF